MKVRLFPALVYYYMIKRCPQCETEKSLYEDFPKNKTKKNGYADICKLCNSANVKKCYLKNKGKYNTYIPERAKKYHKSIMDRVNQIKLFEGCKFCNEKTPCCLDFHHLENKTDMISDLVKSKSWKKIEAEIKKCIVVCANCHRKLHAGIKLEPIASFV